MSLLFACPPRSPETPLRGPFSLRFSQKGGWDRLHPVETQYCKSPINYQIWRVEKITPPDFLYVGAVQESAPHGKPKSALRHNIEVLIRARIDEMADIWRKYYASIRRRVICCSIITVYEKTESCAYVCARFGHQVHDTDVSWHIVLLTNGV